jgi:hypothetical protein
MTRCLPQCVVLIFYVWYICSHNRLEALPSFVAPMLCVFLATVGPLLTQVYKQAFMKILKQLQMHVAGKLQDYSNKKVEIEIDKLKKLLTSAISSNGQSFDAIN